MLGSLFFFRQTEFIDESLFLENCFDTCFWYGIQIFAIFIP